jgi:WhiB family transcriptional regulator, redox-sensing transcriptional regulator
MATLPLLAGAPSTSWQAQGLCRTADSAIFFPPAQFEHKPEREAREKRAKAICSDCPVRAQCLEWALTTREPHGVWGGYAEAERKQMLAGKARIPA